MSQPRGSQMLLLDVLQAAWVRLTRRSYCLPSRASRSVGLVTTLAPTSLDSSQARILKHHTQLYSLQCLSRNGAYD